MRRRRVHFNGGVGRMPSSAAPPRRPPPRTFGPSVSPLAPSVGPSPPSALVVLAGSAGSARLAGWPPVRSTLSPVGAKNVTRSSSQGRCISRPIGSQPRHERAHPVAPVVVLDTDGST